MRRFGGLIYKPRETRSYQTSRVREQMRKPWSELLHSSTDTRYTLENTNKSVDQEVTVYIHVGIGRGVGRSVI